MRLLTYDDIFDLYYRLNLKGIRFLGSKLTTNKLGRTRSSFNNDEMQSSNWWNIPEIRNRWNEKITGNAHVHYSQYVYEKYLKNQKNIRLLSPGCGVCTNELRLASYPVFSEISCIDLAEKPLESARKIASEKGYSQFKFIAGDINEMVFSKNYYDLVLFNSSLHHFKNVENLLLKRISDTLKPDGLLLINEYVGPNRLQWSSAQLKTVNELLRTKFPVKYKKRYKSSFLKERVSGPGIIRMRTIDPSEAIDSESIIPALRKGFTTLEEKNPGGNLLMILLKDIAFHFADGDPEALSLLKDLMEIEDDFMKTEKPANIFGIYRKKQQ
jgi:ubiquinone/menaquinone biosynthesis C-methylase UbiE